MHEEGASVTYRSGMSKSVSVSDTVAQFYNPDTVIEKNNAL